MSANTVREARAAACVRLDGKHSSAGFALPLFAHPTRPNQWLVQEVDEFSERVTSFKKLEGDEGQVVQLPHGPVSRAGSSPIYAFVTDDGLAHAGTLDQLRSLLMDFVTRCPNRTAIVLQVLELVGTREEKRAARHGMRKIVLETAGEEAAHSFYEGSLLRSALWDHLRAGATDENAARRILALRSRTTAKVVSTGAIALDLSALDPKDYARTSAEAIARELESEFERVTPLPRDDRTEDFEVASGNEIFSAESVVHQPVVERIIRQIRNAKRQEERLAILLGAILGDRFIGARVLQSYPPERAKYARGVLQELANVLGVEPPELPLGIPHVRQVPPGVLARIVWSPFAKGMPGNRAALLHFMAKHLAKFPEMNTYLQARLDNSRSIFMTPERRKQIQRFLNIKT